MKQTPGTWSWRTGPSPGAEWAPPPGFLILAPVLVPGVCHKQPVWTQTAAPAAAALAVALRLGRPDPAAVVQGSSRDVSGRDLWDTQRDTRTHAQMHTDTCLEAQDKKLGLFCHLSQTLGTDLRVGSALISLEHLK